MFYCNIKDSRETLRLPGVFNLYAVWGRVRLLGHFVKFSRESCYLSSSSVLVISTLCSCLHVLLLSVLESLLSLFNIACLNCSQESLFSILDVIADSDVASCLLVDNFDSLLCGFNISN